VNIALLQRLRAEEGRFVPLDGLGPDIAATAAALDELERFGFVLERHPILGVAYRAPAASLCPDQIEWGLNPLRVGRRIAVWSRVTSTNDLAARAAASLSNDGLVILAEEQTAGRGRLGRSWQAPRGSSLLLSLLLFPPSGLDQPWWLTALGAVAVAEVVEQATGRPCSIKWPNDVRIERRKVAGVLVERGKGSILGIGLNVNLSRDDFAPELRDSATSLSREAGTTFDRSELARLLIQRLDARYDEALTSGPGSLDAQWSSRLESCGHGVRIATRGGTLSGRLTTASLAAGLGLLRDDGRFQFVPIAEILDLAPQPS
jgi:BirA family biotin operon repressor/biotin-[acetyl-CoA-carboxylase] ligase